MRVPVRFLMTYPFSCVFDGFFFFLIAKVVYEEISCKTCQVHTDMFLTHFPKICGKWPVTYEINLFPSFIEEYVYFDSI